jgi:GT2 family glycosyltransferase
MISVVIPTCRRPDLIAKCLDALGPGTQSLAADQYEVIVTDDGQPTVETLLADKYPWAKWALGPRRGPAANRNNGARLARGEWIAFTDDDCIPDPTWLAAFAGAIHDGCRVYEGKTTCRAGMKSPLEISPANDSGGFLWSCNMLVRADLFKALGGFDETFPGPAMEDVDFRERLLAGGDRFEFVPSATVDHPPRRMASGLRLGRGHESWVYWWYKSGHRGLASSTLLREIVSLRLRFIFWVGRRFGFDSIRALASLAMELGVLCVRLPFWEWKYRRRRQAAVLKNQVAGNQLSP